MQEELGSFIVSEIRELRRSQEGRDGEMRGEMAAIRDAVATLSESLSRSHNNVEVIRGDVEEMRKDQRLLRKDVDDIQRRTVQQETKTSAAWDGPKKIITTIGLIGGAAVAVLAVLKLLPLVGFAFVAIPPVP